MRIGIRTTCPSVLACLFWLALTTASPAGDWKAGTARAKITPQHPMPLSGFAFRGSKHSEGTLTELWAKALVLEDAEGHRGALVTLDLLGVDRGLSQAICQEIQEQQKWNRSQIAICPSHTHTGPVVKTRLSPTQELRFGTENQRLIGDYVEQLKPVIVGIVAEATSRLKPAELSYGGGQSTVAVNRRENKPKEVPALRSEGRLKGPSDYDVPVLVVRQEGKPAAIVFGYACHNTVLSSLEWSGDYAGFAQLNLERANPGCQAMYWAGCGGDQDPLPRGTVEQARDYGDQVAKAVQEVVDNSLTPIDARLSTRYQEIDLPLGELPTREKLERDTKSNDKYIAARAELLLRQLDNGQPLRTSYPYPVGVWKFGNAVTFVLLGGEPVVDYALRLKTDSQLAAGGTRIWCAGYANDVMAYIPSKRVLLEGGYEGAEAMVHYGFPAAWAPEVEEIITKAVQDLSAQ
jgi:hypothetical protein